MGIFMDITISRGCNLSIAHLPSGIHQVSRNRQGGHHPLVPTWLSQRWHLAPSCVLNRFPKSLLFTSPKKSRHSCVGIYTVYIYTVYITIIYIYGVYNYNIYIYTHIISYPRHVNSVANELVLDTWAEIISKDRNEASALNGMGL